jgi:L-aminopeptidase/D-esterase-like protein
MWVWRAESFFPHFTDSMTNSTQLERLRLPDGFRFGHWTDAQALTGCTVILCPSGTVGGCDVRGGAPGSRELALLASEKSMQEVHAVLLTGGSAFGLAAADGVMRYLEERGIGYPTPCGRVPIVPAAVIFDLNVGRNDVRPNAESGYAACASASEVIGTQGAIGVGIGATVGKWAGMPHCMRGGLGVATVGWDDLIVTAIVVVNALGDVLDANGRILAGARCEEGKFIAETCPFEEYAHLSTGRGALQNTTLVALLTNAALSKIEVNKLSQRAHDGMARSIKPVHTSFDGDMAFGLSCGSVHVPFDVLAEAGAEVTSRAIRSAVTSR